MVAVFVRAAVIVLVGGFVPVCVRVGVFVSVGGEPVGDSVGL